MQLLRGPFALALCVSLIAPPGSLYAGTESNSYPHGKARAASSANQLQGDARILHALNRFTFGSRPGDLEAVRAVGLNRWFEQQLHPETLDETGLNRRLGQFPALESNPQDLLYRLPSNAIIRQAIDGKAPIPEDGVLHAIYQNQIARVRQRKQEKEPQASAAVKPAMDAGLTSAMNSTAAIAPSQSGSMTPPSKDSSDPAAEDALVQPLIAEALKLSPGERIARLAILGQPEFDAFRKAMKPQQRAALTAGMSPAQKEQLVALENPQRAVVDELAGERLTRDIYSNAQLREVMTDFWLNHFNVYLHKNEETPYYLVSFERDVIRPHALGKFEDLLEATAHSPAMLLYLDNASSMGPDSPAAERTKVAAARHPGVALKTREGLNENYARELMELHTLGVNGGYTQADVTEVARILTGWTIDKPQRGGNFKFDENRHQPGDKKVLGKKFGENGEEEGRELLHMLATRPATARFICRKLAIRFVADEPPQTLVDRMAKSYLSSSGDISAVLRTLFHSPEFWSAAAYREKVKTPLEFTVSALRASGAEVESFQSLANSLREMGMPLYGCIPPTGYSWQASTWVSTGALVNRMNFALALATNHLPGIATNWPAPQDAAGNVSTSVPLSEAEERRLESLLVAGGVSAATRAAVLDQFRAQDTQNQSQPRPLAAAARSNRASPPSALEKQDQLLAGLLLGSPEFQRR